MNLKPNYEFFFPSTIYLIGNEPLYRSFVIRATIRFVCLRRHTLTSTSSTMCLGICIGVSALSKFKNKNLRFNFSVVRSLRIFFCSSVRFSLPFSLCLCSLAVRLYCRQYTWPACCVFDSEAHSNTCTIPSLTHTLTHFGSTNTSASDSVCDRLCAFLRLRNRHHILYTMAPKCS